MTGIDAIIGGDSHTLLGDFPEATGLSGDGAYPTIATNADGDTVCIVQAWEYAKVVGQLDINFTADGTVDSCGGKPTALVGNFTREVDDEQVAITDPELSEIVTMIDGFDTVEVVDEDAGMAALIQPYADQVDALASEVIAQATEDLCLNRIPGDGRGGEVCAADTVAASGARSDVNGGFIQQLVADGFLALSNNADISLQNSGGVRINIPAGDITVADVFTLLPFPNTTLELELTGAEVVQALEDGVSNIIESEGSTGAYSYAAGLRWDVDLSKPAGERFTNVEVRSPDADGDDAWAPISPNTVYVVATNDFMGQGGDGYAALGVAYDEGRYSDIGLPYAEAFLQYITENLNGSVAVPAPEDFSTQSFTDTDGTFVGDTSPPPTEPDPEPDPDPDPPTPQPDETIPPTE